MASTMKLVQVAALYYPVIVTQLMGEISEAKAAELLGRKIEEYRDLKYEIRNAVLATIESLPSPLILLLDDMKALQKSSEKSQA